MRLPNGNMITYTHYQGEATGIVIGNFMGWPIIELSNGEHIAVNPDICRMDRATQPEAERFLRRRVAARLVTS